jgi:hypothetical protein
MKFTTRKELDDFLETLCDMVPGLGDPSNVKIVYIDDESLDRLELLEGGYWQGNLRQLKLMKASTFRASQAFMRELSESHKQYNQVLNENYRLKTELDRVRKEASAPRASVVDLPAKLDRVRKEASAPRASVVDLPAKRKLAALPAPKLKKKAKKKRA